jgi:hypothetical protein
LRVEGSSATYSLVDIRDGHDVIDWFPGEHPPMTDIIRHGPASLKAERARAGQRAAQPALAVGRLRARR